MLPARSAAPSYEDCPSSGTSCAVSTWSTARALPLGWIIGDCLDPAVADEAVAGVDAVVHLAGNPNEASLPESLESHVHTTGRLLEAMLAHGVTRMVYASSNHAVGHTPSG